MALGSSSTLSIPVDDVVWREVGDDLIVLELATSSYLMINGTGKVIWESLVEATSEDALVALIVDSYDIPDEQARSDVQAFLVMLQDRGLLVTAE